MCENRCVCVTFHWLVNRLHLDTSSFDKNKNVCGVCTRICIRVNAHAQTKYNNREAQLCSIARSKQTPSQKLKKLKLKLYMGGVAGGAVEGGRWEGVGGSRGRGREVGVEEE